MGNVTPRSRMEGHSEEEFEPDTAEASGSGGEDETHERPSKRRKQKFALPTTEEMIQLQETSDLFNSNLNRLQIEELINQVSCKYTSLTALEEYLRLLKERLTSMPTEQEHHEPPPALSLFKDDSWQNTPVSSPQAVKVVGSYLLRTNLSVEDRNIDLAVEMRKDTIFDRDIKNHKYSDKRQLFIAAIMRFLEAEDEVLGHPLVQIAYLANDTSRPIIAMTPPQSVGRGRGWTIRLIPTLPQDAFALTKLTPDRSNLPHGSQEDAPPTPEYNPSIASDMLLHAHLLQLHTSLADHSELKNCVLLIKVWLRQRSWLERVDGFNGFLLTMWFGSLINHKHITPHMSSYQAFRVFMQHIVDLKPENKSAMLWSPDTTGLTTDVFTQHAHITLLDHTGCFNLFQRVSPVALKEMQEQARLSLQWLTDTKRDGFGAVFLEKVSLVLGYDTLIKVEGHQALAVTELLIKGLGPRISSVGITVPKALPHPASEVAAPLVGLIGLRRTALANRLVDRGPDPKIAPPEEIQAFKALWGSKSELRRFKDGAIVHACVWTKPAGPQADLLSDVCRHLIGLHFADSIAAKQDSVSATQVDALIAWESGPTPEERFAVLGAASDRLLEAMRRLEGLPLAVTMLHARCSSLRQTSVAVPVPNALAGGSKDARRVTLEEVHEVLLEVAPSARWPTDVQAIQKLKTAFYLKLRKLLQQEHGITSTPSHNFLDVLFEGFVFRVRLHYHKEVYLWSQSSAKLAGQLQTAFSLIPNLSHRLNSLTHTHSAMCRASRLAKRWLACHMLSPFFTDECVDLLVASSFLHPRAFSAPTSGLNGLVRFLWLLSSTDWNNTPMLVDLEQDDASLEEVQRFQKLFDQRPEELQGVPFLASAVELRINTPNSKINLPIGTIWTASCPPVVFQRTVQLARECYEILTDALSGPGLHDVKNWKAAFEPRTGDFDAVIRLVPHHTPNADSATKPVLKALKSGAAPKARGTPYKNLSVKQQTGTLLAGHNPVKSYLADLVAHFDDYALFFNDGYGGDVIGVVWKPKAFLPKAFSLEHCQNAYSFNSSQGEQVIPNVAAIVSDMKRLGQGLVDSITLSHA
eukprot:c1378_g1_i1.p1 GENE.c1378_g1_i1~~c1378_g1_i1.p1  ORF type:complete len:1088 (+),score=243.10 c1378_g1_i1:1-3264(+)